jgi:DNA repair and recombination protein RAD52
MFTEAQQEMLKQKLNPKAVSQRSKAGVNLSYVEGWHVIAEANRIFGFGGWHRETVYNKQVCRYEYSGKVKVGYEAMVRITVDGVTREGTGHGSQVAKDEFDAIEGAAKEAETDAMKRAFMTFGNPFGLALYDKTQKSVGVELTPEQKKQQATKWVKEYLIKLNAAADSRDLMNLQTDNSVHLTKIMNGYPDLAKEITEATDKKRAA